MSKRGYVCVSIMSCVVGDVVSGNVEHFMHEFDPVQLGLASNYYAVTVATAEGRMQCVLIMKSSLEPDDPELSGAAASLCRHSGPIAPFLNQQTRFFCSRFTFGAAETIPDEKKLLYVVLKLWLSTQQAGSA